MNEMIIEHPIMIIETLLKMGQGDEGRLLYLRKALTNGKTIYDSDKKYLKKICHAFYQNQDVDPSPKDHKIKIKTNTKENEISKKSSFELSKKYDSDDGCKFDTFEFEMQTLQNSIEDLKKKESQIKDNLELITINREILIQRDVDKSSSFGKFSNLPKKSSSDLFDLLATKPVLEKSTSFRISKYGIMTCVSAGLFSLWFASYMNLINLGPMKGLSLGLSACSAIAAALFFKRTKTNN